MGEEPVAYSLPAEATSHQAGPAGGSEVEAYPEEGETVDAFKALPKEEHQKEAVRGFGIRCKRPADPQRSNPLPS